MITYTTNMSKPALNKGDILPFILYLNKYLFTAKLLHFCSIMNKLLNKNEVK